MSTKTSVPASGEHLVPSADCTAVSDRNASTQGEGMRFAAVKKLKWLPAWSSGSMRLVKGSPDVSDKDDTDHPSRIV